MVRLPDLIAGVVTVLSVALVEAQMCNNGQQCTIGCCPKDGSGFCGLGPDFCGAANCNPKLSLNGTCNQLAECDPGKGTPGWGTVWGEFHSKNPTLAGSSLRVSLIVHRLQLHVSFHLSPQRLLQSFRIL